VPDGARRAIVFRRPTLAYVPMTIELQKGVHVVAHADCLRLDGCHRMHKFKYPVCHGACARRDWLEAK
jgi:hypothetical protein